jgi:SAM-dependent methyltransferase
MNMHGTENPSAWVQRWAHLIAPGSTVLDVACGAGRHMQWLAAQGHHPQGVDRNADALAFFYGLLGNCQRRKDQDAVSSFFGNHIRPSQLHPAFP